MIKDGLGLLLTILSLGFYYFVFSLAAIAGSVYITYVSVCDIVRRKRGKR